MTKIKREMMNTKKITYLLISLFITLNLSSCSTDIDTYKNAQSPLDIKSYFDGNVMAWGMIQDYRSQVTRRFCVDIIGTWEGNIGTLDETFYFSDGEVSTRIWTLNKIDKQSYIGTADDVIGQAQGKQKGIAFHWQYTLAVPVDGKTYQFFLNDWMYKIDEKRLFNRTSMQKFGIDVAEISLFFEKTHSEKSCKQGKVQT